jgi:hypothetical protein
VSEERAPFNAHDTSWQAEAMRDVMGGLFKVLGVMVTGGSSTVPDSFDKLREAGAVARETLKLAASRKTGVPVAQLRTARGAVQLPDGKELKYTELAEIAAALEPVKILAVTNGVAVVADNTWRAIQAAKAIECDWGPAPHPPEMKDHWAAVAASFTPERLNKAVAPRRRASLPTRSWTN